MATIAGTFPAKGLRVALELASVDDAHARYRGAAYTPEARHDLAMSVEVATGAASVEITDTIAREGERATALDPLDVAFVRQLGRQLWRLATQTPEDAGGGAWPRRIQRWRGPK